MASEVYRKYAVQWVEEAILTGIVLGILGYFTVTTINGLSGILFLLLAQFAAAVILIYSLFGKVESMIYQITEVDQSTAPSNNKSAEDEESPDWSHSLLSDSGTQKMVKVSDGVREAKFVVSGHKIEMNSKIHKLILTNEWEAEAIQYLEDEFQRK